MDPDVIVTVNVVDRKIATQVSPVPVLELGHKMHIRAAPPKTGKRHGLFFCGSFHDRNSPNYDSLHWFLTEVWPILRQSLPDTKLTIAGYSAPDVDVDALLEPHPGVVYLGKVDDLVPCYDAARCFIAPTRYAGGVPHKVHEAMAMGCPVVCTDLLRRQLMTQDTTVEDVTVLSAGHDDPVAFAAACLHILESDACFDDLQDRAMDFVKANVSDTSFAAQLRDILNVV